MIQISSLRALEQGANERLPFQWDAATHSAWLLDASDAAAIARGAAESGGRVTAVDAGIVAFAAGRCWSAAEHAERRVFVLHSLFELDDDLAALRANGTEFDVLASHRSRPGMEATLSVSRERDLEALILALWPDCDAAEVWLGSGDGVGRASGRGKSPPFEVGKGIDCVLAMLDRPDRCLIVVANELADSLRERLRELG